MLNFNKLHKQENKVTLIYFFYLKIFQMLKSANFAKIVNLRKLYKQ